MTRSGTSEEHTSAVVFAPLLSVGSKFVNSLKRHTEDNHLWRALPYVAEHSLWMFWGSFVTFICFCVGDLLSICYWYIWRDLFVCFTANLTEGRLFFTNKDHDQRSINGCSCLCKVPVMSCLIVTSCEMCWQIFVGPICEVLQISIRSVFSHCIS